MCVPTTKLSSSSLESSLKLSSKPRKNIYNDVLDTVWPLHPSTAITVLALLIPSYTHFFLNRGFTVWFHWASLFCFVTTTTKSKTTMTMFLERFLLLSGISISIGWYSCLAYEYVWYGRFFDALYKNMPSILCQYMIIYNDNDNSTSTSTNINTSQDQENGTLDFESYHSLTAMAISHILDLLGHPLLTYYFWRRHNDNNKNNNSAKINANDNNSTTIDNNNNNNNTFISIFINDICSWPVIVSSFMYSRIWSVVHTYYNFGSKGIGFYYIGYDVYVMDTLDSWYPAYLAETCIFTSLVLWKLYTEL